MNDDRALLNWFQGEIEAYERDPGYLLEEVLFEVNEDLVRAMKEQGITRAELARRIRRSRSHVTQLLNGMDNVTVKTLVTVAHALGKRVYLRIDDPHRYRGSSPKPIEETLARRYRGDDGEIPGTETSDNDTTVSPPSLLQRDDPET